MKKALLFATLFIFSAASFAESSAQAVIQDAYGSVNHTVKVFAQFNFEVENSTNEPQHYTGYEKIEVQNQQIVKPLDFTLAPHQSLRKGDTVILEFYAKEIGVFVSSAAVYVIGKGGVYSMKGGHVFIQP